MNTSIDLDKFTYADQDIIQRLLKETPMVEQSIDQFWEIPVNEEYIKTQEKKKQDENK